MTESLEHQADVENRKRTDSFLAVFSEIEQLLKKRLSPKRNSNVAHLIKEYLRLNPYWARDYEDLDNFRQIRNLLIHEQSDRYGFPVVVTERSHARLVEIKDEIATINPISRKHKKAVTTIRPDTSLAAVLQLAYKKEFSQFPVVEEGGKFRGLVTENEITRWLGHHVGRKGATVNLAEVAITAVLREKVPDRKQIPIFRFQSLEEPESIVMGLFILFPMLEVVLLTETGTSTSPIEGIVTQWDAARYPAGTSEG